MAIQREQRQVFFLSLLSSKKINQVDTKNKDKGQLQNARKSIQSRFIHFSRLATPCSRSHEWLITFSLNMFNFPMFLMLLSTWSNWWVAHEILVSAQFDLLIWDCFGFRIEIWWDWDWDQCLTIVQSPQTQSQSQNQSSPKSKSLTERDDTKIQESKNLMCEMNH